MQAREMLRKIPESFLQTVRSCCSDQCNVPLDTSRSLFCESVRLVQDTLEMNLSLLFLFSNHNEFISL